MVEKMDFFSETFTFVFSIVLSFLDIQVCQYKNSNKNTNEKLSTNASKLLAAIRKSRKTAKLASFQKRVC